MSKLNDFGAGVDDDPSPEDKTRIKLSEWFKKHHADVYWDKNQTDVGHAYNYKTFSPGTQSRPDMIVKGRYNTYALEVKPGTESSLIHDAFPQMLDYWKAAVTGDADYTIDGQSVDVDAFLLATENSIDGRLYVSDGNSDVIRHNTSDGRDEMAERGYIPTREFNATERVTRVLWRFSKHELPNADIGIGALLSSKLDETVDKRLDAKPMALYKVNGGVDINGTDAYQFWNEIPEVPA